MNPKDPQAELRKTIEKKVRYVAYHGTTLTTWGMVNKATDDLLAIFQALQQQLLTELEDHAVLLSEERADGKHIFPAVPVEAIQRLQNKTNDGGRNGASE